MEDRVTRRIFQANRSRDAAWKQRHRWERRGTTRSLGILWVFEVPSKVPKRIVNFGWNWNYRYFLELMGDFTKFYLFGGSIMFYMSSIYKWPTSRQPHWVGGIIYGCFSWKMIYKWWLEKAFHMLIVTEEHT